MDEAQPPANTAPSTDDASALADISRLLPPRRTSIETASPALSALRASLPTDAPRGVDGVEVERSVLGNVPCLVCRPTRAPSSATVVHFHGGGYRLGNETTSASLAVRMVALACVTVVLPRYALAPEHPFPAALHDAAAVYAAAIDRWGGPTLVSGDSAGGGLAAALVVAGLRSRAFRPAGLLLVSPWLDLEVRAPSYRECAATDGLFSERQAREAAGGYLQGWDAADPLASPAHADVAGFPPTLIFASAHEVLRDDAVTFAGALARSGTTVVANVVAGMDHVWPSIHPELPESSSALRSIAEFLSAATSGLS